MLSGQMDIRGAMSGDGGDPYRMAPSPEELEKQMQAAQFNKQVLLQDIESVNFDLSNAKQVAKYRDTLKMLYKGAQANTHRITFYDRKFVERPEPKWLVHMEWFEYKLKVTPYPVVGQNKKE